jgi:hypothetical protein
VRHAGRGDLQFAVPHPVRRILDWPCRLASLEVRPIEPTRGSEPLSAEDLRQLSIKEFAASLRGGVSKRKRPYQEHTITNNADAARALDRWMTASDMDAPLRVA